jgi:hypothetical protein
MNYATESFNDFASKLGPTDLALYAGAALIIFILFKDRVGPVQKVLNDVLLKVKSIMPATSIVSVPTPTQPSTVVTATNKEDTFFKLVVSWKQTRDLAAQLGCDEAIKVADQMFPYLSPNSCKENSTL